MLAEDEDGTTDGGNQANAEQDGRRPPPARRDEPEGEGYRHRGGRMAAWKGGRPNLVPAKNRLVSRVGEHSLQRLGGQTRPRNERDRGDGMPRPSPVQSHQANRGQHRQQRQRVGEVHDEPRQGAKRRFLVRGELAQSGRVEPLEALDPVLRQSEQDQGAHARKATRDRALDACDHPGNVAREPQDQGR